MSNDPDVILLQQQMKRHIHDGFETAKIQTTTTAAGVVTITGTANEVIVTGTTNPTLSLPQAIATTSNVQFGKLGLNTTTDAGAVLVAAGQYFSAKYTTTITLDWNNGNVQYIQLANGGQTFTFANPKDGARYMLILKQPSSSTAGTVTWPSVNWVNNTAPSLTATNSKVDLITFVYDGTNAVYYGNYSNNY